MLENWSGLLEAYQDNIEIILFSEFLTLSLSDTEPKCRSFVHKYKTFKFPCFQKFNFLFLHYCKTEWKQETQKLMKSKYRWTFENRKQEPGSNGWKWTWPWYCQWIKWWRMVHSCEWIISNIQKLYDYNIFISICIKNMFY